MNDGGLLEEADVHEEPPDPALEMSNVYPFTPCGGLQPYEAFKIKLKTPRLKIRRPGMGRSALAYRDLLRVKSNEAATEIELIYRTEIVKISGKYLQEVIDAIENHACDLILQFHFQRYLEPDPPAAIINGIEFPLEDQEEDQE